MRSLANVLRYLTTYYTGILPEVALFRSVIEPDGLQMAFRWQSFAGRARANAQVIQLDLILSEARQIAVRAGEKTRKARDAHAQRRSL